jgi:hypothetical protein
MIEVDRRGDIETGKLEGHGLGGALVRRVGSRVDLGLSMAVITSHVFLALKYYEGVATVGLLLLITLLVGMGVTYDPDLLSKSACMGVRSCRFPR